MYIFHLKSRCTETESEKCLCDLYILYLVICLVINFWLSEGAEVKGGASPFPL